MASNFRKLSLQRSLNRIATTRAVEEIERTGQALPCRVTAVNPDGLGYAFVTVAFEVQSSSDNEPLTIPQLTLPKAESQWLRSPTQVGDFGITVPADTYVDGISGFDGVAEYAVDYGNMSTLLWIPCGSNKFAPSPDPNKVFLNGPQGAIIGDSALGCYAEFDVASGTITFKAGGKTWTFSAAGLTNDAGVVLESHVHGEIETGTSVSGPPQA